MDIDWVQIRSWHVVDYVSRGGVPHTRCGRWAKIGSPVYESLPPDERSCESCLRLITREQDIG